MEHIPGYDDWKASPPEPRPKEKCVSCGCDLWEGDSIYTIDGGLCEDCLNDEYREVL